MKTTSRLLVHVLVVHAAGVGEGWIVVLMVLGTALATRLFSGS